MPAVTLGLAEVTERLRVLRRRLNTFTLLQALCASLTVACFTSVLLVVLGLRGSGATFRVAMWAGLLVSLSTFTAALAFVRRRWLSPAQTAQVTDQRAELTDRLTTLFDLVTRPRTSRLAPVLVAQTLALGDRWDLRRMAPRRIPGSM